LIHEKFGVLTKYRTLRSIKLPEHAAWRGQTKLNKMWSEDLKEWCCLGDVVVDWRIILRSVLRK